MKRKWAFFICGSLLIAYGCAMKQSSSGKNATAGLDLQGHRGCRGLMPENTIPAMLHALALGVTTLEMDVHITKDSQVVLSHDAWFNADITTKPDGTYLNADEPKYILYQMMYDSISTFDVGTKPYSRFAQQKKMQVAKPLLSVLIDSVERHGKEKKEIRYNIEIKSSPAGDDLYHPKPAPYAELLLGVLRQKGVLNRCIIQSFDVRPLQYIHEHYPDVKLSLLIEDNNTHSLVENLRQLGFAPSVYSPHYSLVTPALVQQCHQKGIQLIPWTVNDLPLMKALIRLGADGLISDYPNLYPML